MSNLRRIPRTWRRSAGYIGVFGVTAVTLIGVASRYSDHVKGTDIFSEYTRQQIKKHPFSGMHEPFITNDTHQLETFQKYFSQYSYLLPANVQAMKEKYALKTPVKIKSLSECPIKTDKGFDQATALIVGGLPALLTGVSLVKSEKKLTYINDERQIPIAYGSAWHLEQDAATEAPTSFRPSRFLLDQVLRATFRFQRYVSIEQTGFFPWRTIDWIGWISHPDHWLRAIRLTLAFQWFTMFDNRKLTLERVAAQCFANEKVFDNLNQEMNGELLLKGKGSVIVARTDEEVADLKALQADLKVEGRVLDILSKDEIFKRYGFLPIGLLYGEKVHDRVLSTNFKKLSYNYIKKHGGKVINGTLTTVYTDDQNTGGIAEYQTPDGQKTFLPFSRLIMSLGSQPILNKNNKPLFDIVAARGVSVLAHVYVPNGCQIPPVLVCGGTNHATKLTDDPVSIKRDDGKLYDLYLMRFTAGACITPNVSDESAPNYDGTIAVGLVSSVRNTFGEQIKIEPISVHGCNRQVSRNGQICWFEPFPGIHIQYGAAGGGLTRAPDFLTNP